MAPLLSFIELSALAEPGRQVQTPLRLREIGGFLSGVDRFVEPARGGIRGGERVQNG